jgi:hypothetical protein
MLADRGREAVFRLDQPAVLGRKSQGHARRVDEVEVDEGFSQRCAGALLFCKAGRKLLFAQETAVEKQLAEQGRVGRSVARLGARRLRRRPDAVLLTEGSHVQARRAGPDQRCTRDRSAAAARTPAPTMSE